MLLILSTRLSDDLCVIVVREQPPLKPDLKSEAGAENPGDKKEQAELVPDQFAPLSGEVAV
jgi:hypothetical protein